MKNPSMFLTYFSSSFQFLHYHAVLLRPRLYNKNDRDFNVANKLTYFKEHILYPLFTIYFSKYLQFPLNTVMHRQNYVTKRLFLQHYGP